MSDLKKHIIILGFMGAGKTTVGRKLAGSMDAPFFDLDEYIETKSGKTINEIFAQVGEMGFRAIESRLLIELLTYEETCVLSLGGGTVCQEANKQYIFTDEITSVYLKYTPRVLASRLINGKQTRPLLKDYDDYNSLLKYITSLLIARERHYLESDMIINSVINKKRVVTSIQNYLEYLNPTDPQSD